MRRQAYVGVLLVLLSACGAHGPSGTRLHFSHGHLILSRSGLPDAEVTPRGSVQVGGWDVPVSADTRLHLVRYHTAVLRLIDHANASVQATDRELPLDQLAEVLKTPAAAPANPGEEESRAPAERLCQDLVSIRSLEQEVTSRVPDLAPYAVAAATPVGVCDNRQTPTAT